MGFLKKIGEILLKVGQVVTGFQPIVNQLFPGQSGVVQTVSTDLAQIAQIVVEVEAVGQALGIAGPDKFKAAAPLVSQIVLQSTIMAHRKIADPTKFQAACAAIGGSMADLLNSLEADVPTASKT